MRSYKLTYNLQKAASLISSGQKQRAMSILAGILAEHPDNDQAWLWMASVVPHPEQRIYCLERVLKIDPGNQAVKERLVKLIQVQPPPTSVSQQAHLGEELTLTDLRCKNCGAPIAEDHIVSSLAMAKCSYCGTVFGIQSLPVHEGKAPEHFRRPEVAMPKGFKVENEDDTWQISWRWFGWGHIFLAVWCVFWDGFLIVWYALSLAAGMWLMVLFPTLHAIIGIVVTYYTLAGFLNRTIVKIGNGQLEIWHHPLPWRGEKRFSTSDVEQIYCKENVSHSSDGTTAQSYEVYTILHQGQREKLVTGLKEPQQALYIEQELEQFLYIQDVPVPGELARH